MQPRVRKTFTQFQKSWPLRKCKHEEKHPSPRGGNPVSPESHVSTAVSTPSDPDRLTIQVVIRGLQEDNEPVTPPRNKVRGQRTGKAGKASSELATKHKGSDGNYDNHARRVDVTGPRKNTLVKEGPSAKKSTEKTLPERTRRRTTSRKTTSRKLPARKTYIWQNEYNVWKNELQYGLSEAEGTKDLPETTSAQRAAKQTLPRAEYYRYSAREHEKKLRQQAALRIQSCVRGWLTRHFLYKLSIKASDMDMPWRTFARDYLRLLDSVRHRSYTVRARPPVSVLILYRYMEKQQDFDDAFDSLTKLTLPTSSLGDFVRRCQVRASQRDVDEAHRYVFKGVPGIDVALLVDTRSNPSREHLKSNAGLAKDITRKLLASPFVNNVSLMSGDSDFKTIHSLSDFSDTGTMDYDKTSDGKWRWNRLTLEKMTEWLARDQKNTLKTGILIADRSSLSQPNEDLEIIRAEFKENQVPLFLIGDFQTDAVTNFVPSARLFSVTSNRSWNSKLDDILEDILRKTKQAYPVDTDDVIDKPLHRVEAMNIVWTIYPPPGSGCAQKKKSMSLYSILDEIEAWDLIDAENMDHADLKKCTRSVVQLKLSRDGYVTLPRADSEGTDILSDVQVAMERIQSLTES